MQVWYPFGFGFVTAHYYGAWVFVGSLALHVAVKLAVNFVRVPVVLSGLLALVYLPSILGRNDRNQRAFTGEDGTGYARNWLEISAALLIASALAYAVSRRPWSSPR